MEKLAYEFPVGYIDIDMPEWVKALNPDSGVIAEYLEEVRQNTLNMHKMKDINSLCDVSGGGKFNEPSAVETQLGKGVIRYRAEPKPSLFYEVLSDECNEKIEDEFSLLEYVKELGDAKRHYGKLKQALMDVEQNGYGVVTPTEEDMMLDEPILVKQGGRYGVKLRARAPSLHIMKVDVKTEVSPLVGTHEQGEELVKYLSEEYENNPEGIWQTHMFGKTLSSLLRDGMSGKLSAMPHNAQGKMRRAVSKIINEGKGGFICILL